MKSACLNWLVWYKYVDVNISLQLPDGIKLGVHTFVTFHS